MSKSYLLFLPIEPVLIGDTFGPETPLPLHCTLVHWFRVNKGYSFSDIHDALTDLANSFTQSSPHSPIRRVSLTSKEPALFGPNNDVPVHVLEHCEGLHMLHEHVLYALGAQVAHSESRWIGSGWHPHVTTVGEREFLPGTKHTPNQFVLLTRDEQGMRQVSGFYMLP